MTKSFLFVLLIITGYSSTRKIEVINKGVEGNTSNDLLLRVEQDVFYENPDIVLLMIGTNDMLNSNKMISLIEYEKNVIELTKKIKSKDIKLVLISPPPVDSLFLYQRHRKELYSPPRTLNYKI